MIHPKRDSLIALILTLAGLAALGWGLARLSTLGGEDVPGGIATAIGGLVAGFSALILLNFRYALRLARRMERGEGVIASWTVPPETLAAYTAAEAALPWAARSRWRPKPGRAAKVLFSNDAILAGGAFHALSARGLQTFTAVNWRPGTPNMIEFPVQEITSSSAHNYAAGKFVLRIPVPAEANEAATTVLAHFRARLADQTRANPTFWRVRRRIGIVALLSGATLAALGYLLAEIGGWTDDPFGLTAMILMIVGVMVVASGIALTLLATSALRRG